MGVTRFPNGVEIGDGTSAGTFTVGGTAVAAVNNPVAATGSGVKVQAGTVIVPTGGSGTAFTTSLSTVTYVVASPYSTVETVAGFAGVAASHSGGTVTLRGISSAGTASTASGTATWYAIGT